MNIYFLGAISGLDRYRTHYERIVKVLKDRGYSVKYEHILERIPNRPETYPIKDDREYARVMKATIKSSDFIVAEVSHTTPNITYEISFALENEIPVLALCLNAKEVQTPMLLKSDENPLLVFHRYKDEELEAVLDRDLFYIEKLCETHFTFNIIPSIKSYLDWVTSHKFISRGLFIRNLVTKAMQEDEEYKNDRSK